MAPCDRILGVALSIVGPEQIVARSAGEVTSPATVDHRTLRPVRGGLFCERIFGPTTDMACRCGRYRGPRHAGMRCEKCGVDVERSSVRRERAGHVRLAEPVAHPWFARGPASPVALLLGLRRGELDAILAHSAALGTGTGAAAVRARLEELDLRAVAAEARRGLGAGDATARARASRRLRVAEAFRHTGVPPAWMILDVLPVIPPGLRPLVRLPGGRHATSDLNELYRRVLMRNRRLRALRIDEAPHIVVRTERRLLQESVDALLGGHGADPPVLHSLTGRPHVLHSLTDRLGGRRGRFRGNLLGKRVDYSGRSVIVPGPELLVHQCGLPRDLALELFEPFVLHGLRELHPRADLRALRSMVDRGDAQAVDVLAQVMRTHPVLLNRAPTLHRLGVQAFLPVLVEGSAIHLHPLVCRAFNADFDGDQMAVHLPLSARAREEAMGLLLASRNVLSPATGAPLLVPTQDMVLGLFVMTAPPTSAPERARTYAGVDDVRLAHDAGVAGLRDPVVVRLPRAQVEGAADGGGAGTTLLTTTVGRVLFNAELPLGERSGEGAAPPLLFVDERVDARALAAIVARCHDLVGPERTAAVVDRLMRLGFREATRSGVSVSALEIRAPAGKRAIVEAARADVAADALALRAGTLAEPERAARAVATWMGATEAVAALLPDRLDGEGSLGLMWRSGARGSSAQFRQLAGMRGLVVDPSGRVVETPITASLAEGLSIAEFFVSAHGARKGRADAALRTADAGYLTRRLVDAAQSVIVDSADCGCPEEERGVLGCRSAGVCRRCYGRDPATGHPVELGAAIGIVAAQSIGEPGAQLTLRSYHGGGVAGGADITRGLPRVEQLLEARASVPEGLSVEELGRWLVASVQAEYRREGAEIDDRHLEVIARAMLDAVAVEDPGDLPLAAGELASRRAVERANARARAAGRRPAIVSPRLAGITRAARSAASWLAAASFQGGPSVLADAAVTGRLDPLTGVKEVALVGGLVPVGTGRRTAADPG